MDRKTLGEFSVPGSGGPRSEGNAEGAQQFPWDMIGNPVGLIKAKTTHLSQQRLQHVDLILVKLQEDQLCDVWTCCTFGQMTWQDQ